MSFQIHLTPVREYQSSEIVSSWICAILFHLSESLEWISFRMIWLERLKQWQLFICWMLFDVFCCIHNFIVLLELITIEWKHNIPVKYRIVHLDYACLNHNNVMFPQAKYGCVYKLEAAYLFFFFSWVNDRWSLCSVKKFIF